jgi:hypothetical protein
MNTNPNPKKVATLTSQQQRQAILQFESREADRRIPEEKKSGCVALLRELIEAVAAHPKPQAGGPND